MYMHLLSSFKSTTAAQSEEIEMRRSHTLRVDLNLNFNLNLNLHFFPSSPSANQSRVPAGRAGAGSRLRPRGVAGGSRTASSGPPRNAGQE